MGKQTELTFEERFFIQKSVQKISDNQIAQILEIPIQALQEELKRCPEGEYDACMADRDARKQKKRSYHILTLEDRLYIQENVDLIAIRQIAQKLDVSVPTVYSELRRCPEGQYDAHQAEMDVQKNRSIRSRNAQWTIQRKSREKKRYQIQG